MSSGSNASKVRLREGFPKSCPSVGGTTEGQFGSCLAVYEGYLERKGFSKLFDSGNICGMVSDYPTLFSFLFCNLVYFV
jgi:hypothetical protein